MPAMTDSGMTGAKAFRNYASTYHFPYTGVPCVNSRVATLPLGFQTCAELQTVGSGLSAACLPNLLS
ncbi:MAG: hypothetical protein NT178_08685 [Proteobacteria bacterium]|nr:hypothetical protein [Pseudomonadota bacterium]